MREEVGVKEKRDGTKFKSTSSREKTWYVPKEDFIRDSGIVLVSMDAFRI